MTATSLIGIAMLLVGAVPAFCQATVKDALARHWKTSGEFTIAVAEMMPDDSYSFRPNPEEMGFGQLMAHIAVVNLNACGNASGLSKPDLPAPILAWSKDAQKVNVAKADAIAILKDSFAFCDKAVAAMTPDKLDNVQGPPNRKLTGFEWLWGYFTHTAHHRGQAEVYLRVKGIKPPDYRF